MKNSKVKRFFFLNKAIVYARLLGIIWLIIPPSNGAFAQNSSYQANTIPLFGSGVQNAAFGIGVLGSLSTGNNNCGFGYFSLSSNTQGSDNTAFGRYSLFSNARPGQNVAIGSESMYLNTDGGENTATGFRSLYNNIDGNYNVSNGAQALFNNTTGSFNTGIGHKSLHNNSDGSTNTAIGGQALYSNVSGDNNTAGGYQSLYYNTASDNTAYGCLSLFHNTSGTGNTGIGKEALSANGVGYSNTALGYKALLSNTNGYGNTANGHSALNSNVSGPENSASGIQALYLNQTGGSNVANGAYALFANISGYANVAIGKDALYNNDGIANVGVGAYALNSNSTGELNTAIGHQSLMFLTTGVENVGVGGCLGSVVTGSYNSALGSGADVSANSVTVSTAIGFNAIVNQSFKMRLGGVTCTNVETQNMYTPSDGRFKFNVIEDDVKGLEFITRLRPVVYNFDSKKFQEFLTKNMVDSLKKRYLKEDFGPSTSIRQSGFIAQEVEKAALEVGYNFNGIHKPSDEMDNYSLSYSQFVVPLVKAVQELNKQKTEQDQKIEKLLQQLEVQQKVITELQKKSGSTTGIGSMNSDIAGFSMAQNEPNPFTHETTVKYAIPQSVNNAYMAVYDLSGKQITTLSIDLKGSSLTITSEKLAAGIYIYSIVADGKIMDSKRMIVADK